jgi:translocation and assembly module TamB
LKKTAKWIAICIFLLIGTLYILVNSSYVINFIAERYAPRYGFTYEKIDGNALYGIVLHGLKYKKRAMADTIRLHINPFTILNGKISVSSLSLLGVNMAVMQKMVYDFTPAEDKMGSQEKQESIYIPFSFAMDDIHLRLKPFTFQRVRIEKEDLEIDSIEYDGERFIVGDLKQSATTSIGDIELRGEYHRRVLDVEYLNISAMDMEAVMNIVGSISNGNTDATGSESDDKIASNTIFIPKEIKAKRIHLTMKPYRIYDSDISSLEIEGENIDIDLLTSSIKDALLHLRVSSDIVDSQIDMEADGGTYRIKRASLKNLDIDALKRMLAILERDKNSSKCKGNSSKSAAGKLSSYPYVPELVSIDKLSLQISPFVWNGVKLNGAGLSADGLEIDFQSERFRGRRLSISADSPYAKLSLNAHIGNRSIFIDEFNASSIDVAAIEKLSSKMSKKRATKEPEKSSSSSSKEKKSSDYRVPFLPRYLALKRLNMDILPYKRASITVDKAEVFGRNLLMKLDGAVMQEGSVKLFAWSDAAKVELSALLRGRAVILQKGENRITLLQGFFEKYKIPLKASGMKPLDLTGIVDEKSARITLTTSGKSLYADSNASFDIDMALGKTDIDYSFESGKLKMKGAGRFALPPYLPSANLTFVGKMHKSAPFVYSGSLILPKIDIPDKSISKRVGKVKINFRGDAKKLSAKLNSSLFRATFATPDMKKASLHIFSNGSLALANFVNLPSGLEAAKASIDIGSELNLSKIMPLKAKYSIKSNIANIDGKLSYGKNLESKALLRVPKKTLLKKMDKNLKVENIFPLKMALKLDGNDTILRLFSKNISAKADYSLESEKIEGKISLADSVVNISGSLKKRVNMLMKSSSVKKLFKNIGKIYKMEPPAIDGDLSVKASYLAAKGSIKASIRSKRFIPDNKARIKKPIRKLSVDLSADLKKKALNIENYSVEVAGMKFFSKRTSKIMFKKSLLKIKELWINDELKIKGRYDAAKDKGRISAKASSFKIEHENAKMRISLDLDTRISKGKIDSEGKIYILGGKVFYNMKAKHYASDEDIIIVQHMREKKNSFFEKNVRLKLYVESKRSLLFKQKDVKVELKPQMSILKEYKSPVMVLGSIDFRKGGYYNFNGKKFVLEKSAVYFTGKPTSPLLNIKLIYRRYGKAIWISVSGSGSEPVLNFSSSPYMTRDQILSFILFDSENSGNSSEDMLSMVGGGLAKSILGNMGLKLDTLVLSQKGFEVGKKISNKVSIIYDQKDESKIIVRVEHSPKVETDISIGQESQSIDIIYKREF